MKPVFVDVFHPIPEEWRLCLSCEVLLDQANLGKVPYDRAQEALPPDWAGDFQKLVDLIFQLADRFGEHIRLRLWDPRSIPGLVKCLRYWIRQYPSFVIDGRIVIPGWDSERLDNVITSLIHESRYYPVTESDISRSGGETE